MQKRDPQDTRFNGLIAGSTTPFIFYFVLQQVSKITAYFLENFDGFSLKLICITAILSNILPLQIFNNQDRGYAMYGVVTMTLVFTFALVYYFRVDFFKD